MKKDLRQPIRLSGNRPEYIIVEYERFIKSLTEALLLVLLDDPETALLNFPKLEQYINMSREDQYYSTVLFYPESFMLNIANGEIPKEQVWDLVDTSLSFNTLERLSKTVFEFALFNLAKESFVKCITIIKRRPYLGYEIQHLSTIFSDYITKIRFVSGDIEEEIFNNDESIVYTTVALNESGELISIAEKDPERAKDTLFVLNANEYNCTLTTDSGIEYKYINDDEIQKQLPEGVRFTRMFPFILDETFNQSNEYY